MVIIERLRFYDLILDKSNQIIIQLTELIANNAW